MKKLSNIGRCILMIQLVFFGFLGSSISTAEKVSAFTLSYSNTMPTQPSIMAPRNHATLRNFPRTASLRWSPVPNAVRYVIEVECDRCGSTAWSKIGTYSTTATRYTTPALPGDNQYRFRVRAVEKDPCSCCQKCAPRPWSAYSYFCFETQSQKCEVRCRTVTHCCCREYCAN